MEQFENIAEKVDILTGKIDEIAKKVIDTKFSVYYTISVRLWTVAPVNGRKIRIPIGFVWPGHPHIYVGRTI